MLTKIVFGEFKIGEIKRKNLKSQSRGRNASTNWLFQNDCREGKKNQKTEREREKERERERVYNKVSQNNIPKQQISAQNKPTAQEMCT